MSDGSRRIIVELTEAQHDVFVEAMKEADKSWEEVGFIRVRDRKTLARAMDRLSKAWDVGVRS